MLPARAPEGVTYERMDVWIEIHVRTECLDGGDHAGAGLRLACLKGEGTPRRFVRRAGKEPEKPPFPFEQAPEHAGDGEYIVAVRHGKEDLFGQFLGEQRRALRLTAGTKIACPAAEDEKKFPVTGRAADSRKTAEQSAARQILFHRGLDGGAERSIPVFEALFIDADVAVELGRETRKRADRRCGPQLSV